MRWCGRQNSKRTPKVPGPLPPSNTLTFSVILANTDLDAAVRDFADAIQVPNQLTLKYENYTCGSGLNGKAFKRY